MERNLTTNLLTVLVTPENWSFTQTLATESVETSTSFASLETLKMLSCMVVHTFHLGML